MKLRSLRWQAARFEYTLIGVKLRKDILADAIIMYFLRMPKWERIQITAVTLQKSHAKLLGKKLLANHHCIYD